MTLQATPPFLQRIIRFTWGKSDRYWLAIIVAIAIVFRVAMAFYMGNTVIDLPGTFDQISYDMLARQLVNGYGFTVAEAWWPNTPAGESTAHWSYLYTLFLAGMYKIFGFNPLVARLVQAVLAGWLMPWLTYRLGRAYFDRRVGLAAAALSAIYIYFAYYAAALMTETFYIISILWVFDVAGRLGGISRNRADELPPKPGWLWLWLGISLGVTVLFRQAFLLFVPFLFAWLLWRAFRYKAQSVWRMALALVAASILLVGFIAPWTALNYQTFNRFVLLNTNSGFVFFWGNHPIHGTDFIPILPYDGPSYQDLIPEDLRHLDEAALDQALLKEGLGFVVAEPGRYVLLSLSRVKEYFKFWPSTDSGMVSNLSRVFSFGLMLPFMLYGFIYCFRRDLFPQALLFYLFIGAYVGIHLLTWTLIRYRLPVDAILLIFAGVALVDIQSRLARRFF